MTLFTFFSISLVKGIVLYDGGTMFFRCHRQLTMCLVFSPRYPVQPNTGRGGGILWRAADKRAVGGRGWRQLDITGCGKNKFRLCVTCFLFYITDLVVLFNFRSSSGKEPQRERRDSAGRDERRARNRGVKRDKR